MLIFIILSTLVLGTSMQRSTGSVATHVLRGWFPNACTLVICGPPETNERDKGDKDFLATILSEYKNNVFIKVFTTQVTGLPATQQLQEPNDHNNSEFEVLKAQIKNLQTELDTFKATIIKTQNVLLTPNGVIVGGKIFKTDGSRGDYNAARDNCSHMGGMIAVPRNAAENSALQQMVTWHNTRVLLGVNDMAREGRFEDPNGNVIDYSNWAPGEPNNLGNEDCGEMHPDGKWHDRVCSLEWLIICEF